MHLPVRRWRQLIERLPFQTPLARLSRRERRRRAAERRHAMESLEPRIVLNAAPVASGDEFWFNPGQTFTTDAVAGVLSNDTDGDDDPLSAILAENGCPAHGTLTLNADGGFSYTPNNGFAGVDSFTYQASDGMEASSPVTVTLHVNTAPTLDGAGVAYLPAVAVNAPAGNGVLVSSLTAGNPLTDADGDSAGVAIVAADNTQGQWQFSLDDGENWTDLNDASDASALLLSADSTTRVRFVANANYVGVAALGFRAWDGRAGAQGERADASQNGGAYAFSATTALAAQRVLPTFSINNVTVNEGDGTATFTVTLSHASTETVTVRWAPADGSATRPDDFSSGAWVDGYYEQEWVDTSYYTNVWVDTSHEAEPVWIDDSHYEQVWVDTSGFQDKWVDTSHEGDPVWVDDSHYEDVWVDTSHAGDPVWVDTSHAGDPVWVDDSHFEDVWIDTSHAGDPVWVDTSGFQDEWIDTTHAGDPVWVDTSGFETEWVVTDGHFDEENNWVEEGEYQQVWVESGFWETPWITEGHNESVWVESGYWETPWITEGHNESVWVESGHWETPWVEDGYWETPWITEGHTETQWVEAGHWETPWISEGHVETVWVESGHWEDRLVEGGHWESPWISEGHDEWQLVEGGYWQNGAWVEGYWVDDGALSFAPGETTKTIVLTLTDDGAAEDVETFCVNLFDASNALITAGQGTATIADNDVA